MSNTLSLLGESFTKLHEITSKLNSTVPEKKVILNFAKIIIFNFFGVILLMNESFDFCSSIPWRKSMLL